MIRIDLATRSDGKYDIDELYAALLMVEQSSQEKQIILRLISPEEVQDIEGTLEQFINFCEHRIAELEGHIH